MPFFQESHSTAACFELGDGPEPCLNQANALSGANMKNETVIANGREVPVKFPCTIEAFLVAQDLLPRSVVVEHNGDAVAPSEFARRQLKAGDRLEVVKIVAGG